MDLDELTRPAPPWLHLWSAPAAEAHDGLWQWEAAAPGKRVARVVRGSKSTTVAGFFDEVAAAMQFPAHFGENWDAFDDCFRDLRRWGEKAPVIVCVTDADRLLGAAPVEATRTLVEALAEALDETNAPAKPKKPRALHVILHSAPEAAAVLHKRWKNLLPSGK